jgi:hypothetical protein
VIWSGQEQRDVLCGPTLFGTQSFAICHLVGWEKQGTDLILIYLGALRKALIYPQEQCWKEKYNAGTAGPSPSLPTARRKIHETDSTLIYVLERLA